MISVLAVYEKGVLRPTEPLDLKEGQSVQLSVYPHLPLQPPRPPTPEEEDYARRVQAVKSLTELHAVMATAPPLPEGYDLIEALNAKYAAQNKGSFFLFHRHRSYNEPEGVWMGWERKRGKIEEFNRLLRGDESTSFAVRVGATGLLPSVRYCITLDSDTFLPRDAAKRLIGVIVHPLNRPRFDAGSGRVPQQQAPIELSAQTSPCVRHRCPPPYTATPANGSTM